MASRYITREKYYYFDHNKFVGYKIRLYPTEEQIKIFDKYFGVCRFIYNYCIDLQEQAYISNSKRYRYMDYSKEIISLRKRENFTWLKEYNLETLRMVSRDVLRSYDLYVSKKCKKPIYKTKKHYRQSFPLRSDRVSILYNKVKIPSIGWVYIDKLYDTNIIGSGYNKSASLNYINYLNCRVVYDGLYYWLCFYIEKTDTIKESSYYKFNNDIFSNNNYSEPIGIDIGCSINNWIVTSSGDRYTLPDFSKEKKKISLLTKKYMHKKRINNLEITNRETRSKNEEKLLKKINKYNKSIVNRRRSKIYEISHELISRKPEYIVLEDLNAADLIIHKKYDNSWTANHIKNFNANIFMHSPSLVGDILSEVANTANIPVIKANREYHSTQICSNCKMLHQNIGKQKIFKCPNCGYVIDRDENAAINLKNYLNPIKPFVVGL